MNEFYNGKISGDLPSLKRTVKICCQYCDVSEEIPYDCVSWVHECECGKKTYVSDSNGFIKAEDVKLSLIEKDVAKAFSDFNEIEVKKEAEGILEYLLKFE